MTWDDFLQLLIAALTIPALYLVARPGHDTRRRWGFVIGTLGQPFWLYSTWSDKKFGIFMVAVFCTWSWATGVWNFWVVPARLRTQRSHGEETHGR